MEELALQAVRKAKAKKTHLTVPGSADTNIKTLCGVSMAAGEYEIIDGPADCQPCLRKKGNRAFISSAYFAQDAGSRLLEMSLARTMAGRRPAASGRRPKLTVVESGPDADEASASAGSEARTSQGKSSTATDAARAATGKPSAARPASAEPGAEDRLGEEELRRLGIASLKRVGPMVYQSPAGALVRLKRQGQQWRIAEVVFDGPTTLTFRSSGRAAYTTGDIGLEEVDGVLRLTSLAGRRLNRGR
ncbi:MAG TPA: hypothetical protein VG329_00185 [Candidatus Dormibacteraeota bacterium]|jgi:hypothetical protein|nr:hypothetical protein [Candidatus Dormibacteraeota bacterium]